VTPSAWRTYHWEYRNSGLPR